MCERIYARKYERVCEKLFEKLCERIYMWESVRGITCDIGAEVGNSIAIHTP